MTRNKVNRERKKKIKKKKERIENTPLKKENKEKEGRN